MRKPDEMDAEVRNSMPFAISEANTEESEERRESISSFDISTFLPAASEETALFMRAARASPCIAFPAPSLSILENSSSMLFLREREAFLAACVMEASAELFSSSIAFLASERIFSFSASASRMIAAAWAFASSMSFPASAFAVSMPSFLMEATRS